MRNKTREGMERGKAVRKREKKKKIEKRPNRENEKKEKSVAKQKENLFLTKFIERSRC